MDNIFFSRKKVLIMGLGLHGGGLGSLKFLYNCGAILTVTDLRSKDELAESLKQIKDLNNINYILGQHREADFANTDFVIKNPGVPESSPYLKIAKDNGAQIISDIGIFFLMCPAKIIGVTGTKGKSTTSALLAEILSTQYKTVLAGNIRTSVLDVLPDIIESNLVVLELSSWQLADAKYVKISPQVAVITNILPDHLNRYASMEEYFNDKKYIFKFQNKEDLLILNYQDELVKSWEREAGGKVIFFNKDIKNESEDIYYQGNKLLNLADTNICGQHNISNINAALAVADEFKILPQNVKKGLLSFKGLEGRFEKIASKNGVDFINDTTATTPDSAIAAILSAKKMYKSVYLIAGGADKNLKINDLGREIADKISFVALLEGSATVNLQKIILSQKSDMPNAVFPSMKEAVIYLAKIADSGDAILLSPGFASFGMFKHEFDRGNKFKETVLELRN